LIYRAAVAVCSFARLFAKLPQPGDSKVTFSVFESSCHLLLPCPMTQQANLPAYLHTNPFNASDYPHSPDLVEYQYCIV